MPWLRLIHLKTLVFVKDVFDTLFDMMSLIIPRARKNNSDSRYEQRRNGSGQLLRIKQHKMKSTIPLDIFVLQIRRGRMAEDDLTSDLYKHKSILYKNTVDLKKNGIRR